MLERKSLTQYIAAFVDELIRSGTNHVVISPGSRSTPLAMVMAEHPDLTTWLHVDERSAAFFALGIAKAKHEPVAILCTSGTAAANYYPAVIEAKLARVPLIVLTADRPPELQDSGAPQTIDQLRLFGTYPKWFVHMPLPEASDELLRFARISATRAASTALSTPAGPVHLNFPFREPLLPDLTLPAMWESGREQNEPHPAVITGTQIISTNEIQQLAHKLSHFNKGVFVCGSPVNTPFAKALTRLAEQLHFPIIADPLSQLRTGTHDKHLIIDSYDAFLRIPEIVTQLQPEVIIRFGTMPVSKAYMQYINEHPHCEQLIIDDGNGWRDPTLSAVTMIHTDPYDFCQQLSSHIKGTKTNENAAWLHSWLKINAISKQAILSTITENDLFEGQVILETIALLPDDAVLFVGNSMPIRDLDTFLLNRDQSLTTLANRGVNGIDGVTSSALGVSTQSEPLVLIIGDLSFYHDLNGLLTAKLYDLNITIIVLNNDGGGIFSFLPQAENKNAHFEQLFGTPIGLDYEHVVTMYNGSFERIQSWKQFRATFKQVSQTDGLHVIEVPTDREENVTRHRHIWTKVTEALKLYGLENFRHDV